MGYQISDSCHDLFNLSPAPKSKLALNLDLSTQISLASCSDICGLAQEPGAGLKTLSNLQFSSRLFLRKFWAIGTYHQAILLSFSPHKPLMYFVGLY